MFYDLFLFTVLHVYFFFGLDLPALLIAIAMACFCGLPEFTSFLMLSEIIFLLEPDFKGINHSDLLVSRIVPYLSS